MQKCRLFHGLTKRGFASALGVREKTIKVWENNISQPTEKSLQKLVPYPSILNDSL
ncbi:helix-turn-helix domain-containing protein [Sporomusa carbonis]|uniref:helix-turn-helix domain-containing protein n=1 Tax=Sporomusa carbonis TaxID=3076075 RepID=UPI003C7AFCDD